MAARDRPRYVNMWEWVGREGKQEVLTIPLYLHIQETNSAKEKRLEKRVRAKQKAVNDAQAELDAAQAALDDFRANKALLKQAEQDVRDAEKNAAQAKSVLEKLKDKLNHAGGDSEPLSKKPRGDGGAGGGGAGSGITA